MAMVYLPAARRHHRSRIRYAFGLLALIGAVVTLVVVTRYPAESATRLAEPVPAPEITVVEWGDTPADAPAAPGPDAPAEPGPDAAVEPNGAQSGVGGGTSTLAEPRHPSDDPQTVAQSLFYSGLLGLAISLAGLGLVGTRRRMW
ncbi:hypothetical protein ACQP1S_00310 [Micromonospora matsumotoense]|uniref:hypothetical protein n=1 Tax=Micromonospora matsumotoense TaxID=121616 RepID=UPI003D8F969F